MKWQDKRYPRGQGWRRQKKAQIVYQVPITSSGCEVTRREWVCSRWGLTEEQSWAMRDGWRWKWRKNQSPLGLHRECQLSFRGLCRLRGQPVKSDLCTQAFK